MIKEEKERKNEKGVIITVRENIRPQLQGESQLRFVWKSADCN